MHAFRNTFIVKNNITVIIEIKYGNCMLKLILLTASINRNAKSGKPSVACF